MNTEGRSPRNAFMREYGVTDMHTAGEPVRIFTDGLPALHGHTLLDKRRDALAEHDYVRRDLMLEPRGHAAMYGVWPLKSELPGAALAVLFTHNEGYSTMCGHATIALGRWVLDQGLVAVTRPQTRFVLECPCGPVSVSVDVDDAGGAGRAAFELAGAHVAQLDAELDVADVGRIVVDVAYGGAFYAVVPASRVGLDFFESPYEQLVRMARRVTRAGREQLRIRHPDSPDLGFLYGTLLTDDASPGDASPTYNLCAFGNGQVDRSATGSGVAARMALDHARDRLPVGAVREFRGVSGLGFVGQIIRREAGGVSVRVSGQAHYIGQGRLCVEASDPLAAGFELPRYLREVRHSGG